MRRAKPAGTRAALFRAAWMLALSALPGGCSGDSPVSPTVAPLPTPAARGSRVPHLASSADTLYLSWIENGDAAPARVLYARREGARWSEPRVIVEDERLFVNWADFPTLVAGDDGLLAAHWLRRSGEHPYAYGIRLSVAAPADADWGAAVRPHEDDGETEHGFVSLVAEGGAVIGLVWLDGRAMRGADGAMQLRYRRWSAGELEPERLLDPDVCTCCQTAAVSVGGDLLVAYRDHTAGEIRDISIVRRTAGSWSDPRPLHADGWHIAGCPVNGPAAATDGRRVAVAWFTDADEQPRVLVSFSADGGGRFEPPLRVDDGNPLGRVDVEFLPSGAVAVSWMEKVSAGAEIRLRFIDVAGASGPSTTVARTQAGRPAGFPRLAVAAGRLFLAWTDPTSPPRVRMAHVQL